MPTHSFEQFRAARVSGSPEDPLIKRLAALVDGLPSEDALYVHAYPTPMLPAFICEELVHGKRVYVYAFTQGGGYCNTLDEAERELYADCVNDNWFDTPAETEIRAFDEDPHKFAEIDEILFPATTYYGDVL